GGRLGGDGDGRTAIDRPAFLVQPRDGFRLWFGSVAECGGEAAPDVGQRDAVLRALGAGEAWLDLVEVELEQLAELRRRCAVDAEHPLLFRVALDEIDLLAAAPGDVQVAQSLLVDREEG